MKIGFLGDVQSHIDTWLIVAAFAVALFFLGHNILIFSIAYALLLVWLVRIAWRAYDGGFSIPRTGLGVWLTLYWVWLGITLLWSPVPFVSKVTFWWMSAFPLAFWLFTIAPNQDRLWSYGVRIMVIVGLILGSVALYQVLIIGVVPRGPFVYQNLYAALLSLFALPIAAYIFNLQLKAGRRWKVALLSLVFFVLVFAIAAAKSRGAILSFGVGLGLLLIVAWPHTGRRRMALIGALVVAGFALANLTLGGDVAGRLQTLSDPQAAGTPRFLIWSRSWQMVEDHPWGGIGLGLYPLLWPAYRHPLDTTGGYFAHNDYLHLWIEAGLPALILFLNLLGLAAWRVGRSLLNRSTAPAKKIEIAGLGAALLAVATHSFLDFNFYVLSTLILFGLILARLQTLTNEKKPAVLMLRPARHFGRGAYKTLSLLLVLFPLLYFIAIGIASYETDRSIKLAQQGFLNVADRALARAARLWPDADSILMTRGDLYRHILTLIPASRPEERKIIFQKAAQMLDRAAALDPLRPEIFMVRAELYRQNPLLAGSDWRAKAEQDYQHALRVNPRYYHARVAYARLLLASGSGTHAREVLEAGLHHRYFDSEQILPYYAMTAKLRAQAGDKEGTEEMNRKIQDVLTISAQQRRLAATPAPGGALYRPLGS